MSDVNAEPGARTAKNVDGFTEKISSKEVSTPKDSTIVVKQLDNLVLRLKKVLAAPGGLPSFLSTFNYTLYILAYAQTKTPQLSQLAHAFLSYLNYKRHSKSPPKTITNDATAIPPIAALAGLISRARTTLRLFGLIPMYAWLRTLQAGPKPDQDPILHKIALTQCLSYIAYQSLENISVLADNGIIPSTFIARLNRGNPATTRVYLWAYRAWCAGVTCDFIRLAREAQVERKRRAVRARMQSEGHAVAEIQDEEDRKFDAKWWGELMIAMAWFPMSLHFSSTSGVPGWNLGWMGACGLVAGGTRWRQLWASTA